MPDELATSWEEIRATRVVHEDEHLLVLDKPAGVSVTGERHGTDLVREAAADGEDLRPVHRIDKVTSGVILLAKTAEAHGPLTRQFARREVAKQYLAVTATPDAPGRAEIDLPLVTPGSGRVRIAAPRSSITLEQDPDGARFVVPPGAVDRRTRSFPSQTSVQVIARDDVTTLLSVWPRTGRRHQIRVHLAWIGHPVAGDPLFGTTSHPERFPRTMLHSLRVRLALPWTGAPHTFQAPPGPDLVLPAGLEGSWLDRAPSVEPT